MTLTRTIPIEIVAADYRAEIEFVFHRGYRGTYFDPPESPSVEIESVTLLDKDDKPIECPAWLEELIASTDYIRDELLEYAQED